LNFNLWIDMAKPLTRSAFAGRFGYMTHDLAKSPGVALTFL
jgi:hypothetical protein